MQRRSTAGHSSLPTMAFEKEKSSIPVLDLAPLGIEPISYLKKKSVINFWRNISGIQNTSR